MIENTTTTEDHALNYYDFSETKGDYNHLSEVISRELDTIGYVIVKNFDADVMNKAECDEKFLKISQLIGNPIPHDNNNSIIWDIKANPASKGLVKTYSEHSHEAELHTDSQYSYYPEDYFGLLTLKKASCGGGISYLLSLQEILSELRDFDKDGSIEHTLRTKDFPFIVPDVFKKKSGENKEFNFGPILRDNEIRFRVDTFEKAIQERPDLCAPEQIQAYKALKSIIINSAAMRKFFLNEHDLIFINNKTMLHGRSQFTDNTRHLLRIRLNKFSASA
ncbi:MAG: TauD/TfdA family dioxygenase [Bacteroidota bacterium]